MEIFEKMAAENLTKIEIRPDCVPFHEAEWIAKIMKQDGHEKLYLFCHSDVALRAAIAIHNRTLSKQALGGIRMWLYPTEREAILDVLRLSKAMTYKAAMAGIQKGGAKCVVLGNKKPYALLWKLAEEIEALKGEYLGGTDMNMTMDDVRIMRQKTRFVAGLPKTFRDGGYRGSGDSGAVTAEGIVYGMKECLRFLNMGFLWGKTIAIQGLGKVGYSLSELLYQEGAREIIGCDPDHEKVSRFIQNLGERDLWEFRKSVRVVEPEEIFSQACDIFAPCANGAVLREKTIRQLKCKIVAGSANNQLEYPQAGQMLYERNILYAPDYVMNAGGLINIDDELHPEGYNEQRVQKKLESISDNLRRIFWFAKKLNLPTNKVADLLAEEIIELGA